MMLSIDQQIIVKKTAEELFARLDQTVRLREADFGADFCRLNLQTDEPQLLIGQDGQVLADLQHVLNLILRQKCGAPVNAELDVNDYKKRKKEYLEELAKTTADEVSLTKTEKELPAMSAWERRIVHLALGGRNDVKSESLGNDPDRRIVIKPV